MENKIEPVIEVSDKSSMQTQAENLQKAIDAEYRTDYMTLPSPPKARSDERDKNSAIERAAILAPYLEPDAVVDGDGTTKQEMTDRLVLGKLPNAKPEKHEVVVEEKDGKEEIVILAPADLNPAIPAAVSEDPVETVRKAQPFAEEENKPLKKAETKPFMFKDEMKDKENEDK